MSTKLLVGDCREIMKSLPEKSIHCAVTSPPYFGLRDYGHEDQMGLEETPEAYVAGMVAVFRDLHRVLRDDGTLWLNVGDSYAREPAKGGSGPGGKNREWYGENYGKARGAEVPINCKPKDLIGIPWMLAFALRADGWYLRQDIIWHKPNPMPESVTDRCTKAHEYIFLLSKGPRYYYDAGSIKEPFATDPKENYPARARITGRGEQGAADARGSDRDKSGGFPPNGDKRNKRSVWTVPTKAFKGAHFAVFPTALIEPCILAGCPEGGTVIDPFMGSGTTGVVCNRLRRNCIGIELNPAYAEMANARLRDEAGMFAETDFRQAAE